MLSFLKSHPFAVEAFFESSTVLAFAVPKEELQHLIPDCLELDMYEDKWAFIAVAIVKTKGLRPKGFPNFMGSSFTLIGYRIFVRYRNNAGDSIRGLYILKSETDKWRMHVLGNIFTHYNYSLIDIDYRTDVGLTNISSMQTGLHIALKQGDDNTGLPLGSPFKDWKDARRFAGPLPHTFTYNATTKEVLTIKGLRENWKPTPVQVSSYNIPFIDSLQLKGAVLANAFVITDIPYHWQKGKTEIWQA